MRNKSFVGARVSETEGEEREEAQQENNEKDPSDLLCLTSSLSKYNHQQLITCSFCSTLRPTIRTKLENKREEGERRKSIMTQYGEIGEEEEEGKK